MFRLSRSHTHKSLVPKAVAKVRRAFCPHAYSPPRSLRSAPFCHPAPCSLARVLHRTRESPPPVLSRPPAPAVQHAAPAAARRVPHTPHRQCHPCPARRSVCLWWSLVRSLGKPYVSRNLAILVFFLMCFRQGRWSCKT